MKTQTSNRLMQCAKQGQFTGLHSNQRTHTPPTFRSRLQTDHCPCGKRLIEVAVSDDSVGSCAKHTSAPWRVGDSRAMSDRAPNDPQDMHWPIFWPDMGCGAHVFRFEDAKLIAAAPELLAALEAICGANGVTWDARTIALFDNARAAISKATQP